METKLENERREMRGVIAASRSPESRADYDLLEAAIRDDGAGVVLRRLLRAGLSVLPVRADGSKAPAAAWRRYQADQATEAEAREWSRQGHGVGLVCGYGGVEVIDIDDRRSAEDFFAALPIGLAAKLCRVRTPCGEHLIYRTESPEGNQKLATTITGKTLIETRGVGGYVVTVGSPPACHPSGGTYEHVAGPPLTALDWLTGDERAILLSAARSFDA